MDHGNGHLPSSSGQTMGTFLRMIHHSADKLASPSAVEWTLLDLSDRMTAIEAVDDADTHAVGNGQSDVGLCW